MSLLDALRQLSESIDAFQSGVRAKVERRGGAIMDGRVGRPAASDQALRFKERFSIAGVFDYEVLVRTPANAKLQWDVARGGPLGWLGLKKGRLVALSAVDLDQVIARCGPDAPPEASDDWPALSPEALNEAMRSVKSAPRKTFVAVCSPSGFAPETLQAAQQLAGALVERGGGLVLVEPRADGGWVQHLLERGQRDWHFLFDPEPKGGKIERIRRAIDASELDLAEGGLSDIGLADRLGVDVELVREVFAERANAPGTDFRVREMDGRQVLLGSVDTDWSTMGNESMLDKLRKLFGRKGQDKQKVRALEDKRAMLIGRRDRLYKQLDELGEKESELKKRGVEADSDVTRRRIASELGQIRRRIDQGNTAASLFNRQIDVLSTHIHHLELVEQGDKIDLPDVEEITQDAVKAEELLERVKADSDLVEALAEGTGSALTTSQEDDILAELTAGHEQAEEKAREKAAEAEEKAKAKPAEVEPIESDDEPGRDRPMAAEE